MSNEITLKQDQYIQDLLQQLGELEADKEELLAMVEKLHGANVYQLTETDMRDGIRFPFALYDEVNALT